MELEGSLKAFSLPEILQFLAMGKLSGTLMVRHDGQGIDLVIRSGKIVNSCTLDQTRRLGQMLVNRRLIYRSDLGDVLKEQSTTHGDKMLGQLLVDRELITLDDLRNAIKAQLEEEIWELFSWETGDFRFENRSDTDIQNVLVEIDVEPLIIEGTRRIDEWKAIIRNLRGDRTVLGLNEWKPDERADLTLTTAEWQVLSLINGQFSIASIAARAGIGKFESYRILNTFLAAGIAYIKEERSATAPTVLPEGGRGAKASKESGPVTRRLGFFGKKRGGDVSFSAAKPEQFPTAVGLLGRFLDILVHACFEHRDFNFVEGDDRFLERAWLDVVMDYPAADLIGIEGNRIDVSPLERYLEYGGLLKSSLRCYEDAVEGLRALYGTVAAVFSQRMGERTFQRLVQSLKNEWLPKTSTKMPHGFDFAEFLNRGFVAKGER